MYRSKFSKYTTPPSLWMATAIPAITTTSLVQSEQTDIAIIGGGFTGLSAALHIAKKGTKASILEAVEPGWGASGRNGGQVIPGLKEDPRKILTRFGTANGEDMIKASGAAANLVFKLIAENNIDCEPQQTGWIQAAHNEKMLKVLRDRYEDWVDRDANVDWLEKDQLVQRMGDGRYFGGWIDKRGGGIQPLSYARGLAKAALEQGAKIYSASPVTSLTRDAKGWRLTTKRGTLRAEKVIIATNGYTGDLWPNLAKSIIPVYSVQVATRPLGENMRGRILSGGEVLSDTRRVLWYFRQDAKGRLIMGGGGSAHESGAEKIYRNLRKRVESLLPDAGKIEFDYAWNGLVALTKDHYPHLHELAPGLWAGLGFNGRGVAMATMMGKILANRVLDTNNPDFAFPTTTLKPIQFHKLSGIAIDTTRTYYRIRDAIES